MAGERPRISFLQGGGAPGPDTAAPAHRPLLPASQLQAVGLKVRWQVGHDLKGLVPLDTCCPDTAKAWSARWLWDATGSGIKSQKERKIKAREGPELQNPTPI